MPRVSRIVAVDYPHHITQRGVRSVDIFHDDDDRNQYLQFIKEESASCEIEILVR
jgi:putative transposase